MIEKVGGVLPAAWCTVATGAHVDRRRGGRHDRGLGRRIDRRGRGRDDDGRGGGHRHLLLGGSGPVDLQHVVKFLAFGLVGFGHDQAKDRVVGHCEEIAKVIEAGGVLRACFARSASLHLL